MPMGLGIALGAPPSHGFSYDQRPTTNDERLTTNN